MWHINLTSLSSFRLFDAKLLHSLDWFDCKTEAPRWYFTHELEKNQNEAKLIKSKVVIYYHLAMTMCNIPTHNCQKLFTWKKQGSFWHLIKHYERSPDSAISIENSSYIFGRQKNPKKVSKALSVKAVNSRQCQTHIQLLNDRVFICYLFEFF